VVDWGNGNIDHTGCGSCRLENVYRKEGRYTLTATIVDLNAPSAAAVSQAIVTIDVLPPTPAIECAAVGTDFESVALGAAPPALQAGGATYGTIVSGIVDFGATLSPYLTNKALQSFGSVVTVTFDSDKTSFASGIVVGPFGSGSYQAFNEKGVLVASGNLSFSAIPGSPDLGAYPSFSSPAPFRSVVFSFGALGFMIDNVAASCK
jgi:hypothetical protein